MFTKKNESFVLLVLLGASATAQGQSLLPEAYNALQNKTRISGVIMLDYALQDGINRESDESSAEFNSEIRRARLDVKHKLKKNWAAKLQIGFDEEQSSSEMGDVYIRHKNRKKVAITMGRFKEPFGLENTTSSKHITFLERAMVSKALSPGRNTGLMVAATPSNFTWAFSLMDIESQEKDSAPFSLGARLTWAPINNEWQSLHFGFSASLREMDGEVFEIKERAEIHSADKIIESGEIAVDQMQLLGVELAFLNGSFSYQGEYMSADIQAVDAGEDAVFDGFYVQAGYFLSGDTYQYKNGELVGVQPTSSEGAWELACRYSVLNTRESTEGSKLKTSTLGLNYYYDKNIRLTTNLLYSQSSEAVNASEDGAGVAFRAQYLF